MYLINIPHFSLKIPEKFLSDYTINKEKLDLIIKRFADLYTDDLYSPLTLNNQVLKSDYSRIFIDVERFFDDAAETQFEYGLGWYYTKSPFEDITIRTTKSKKIISRLYHKYHQDFEDKVTDILKDNHICSIIDCHSFSNKILHFQSVDIIFPDICIGFDKYHKDEELIDKITEEFKDYNISFNTPYAGSIVPLKYYKKDTRVKSTMIEINKKLYMNEETFDKKQVEYEKIKKHLNNLNIIMN